MTRSPRKVQHRQPLCSSTMLSSIVSHQEVVEPDLAELVDDHGRAGERCVLQQAVEQRGLAGAEEAGEHGERNGLGGLRAGAVRRARSFLLASVLGLSLVWSLPRRAFGAACAAVVCAGVSRVARAVADVAGAAMRTILGRGRGNGTAEPIVRS